MCPHDPTDSAGATQRDDLSHGRAPLIAADTIRSGDLDPTGAMHSALDSSRDASATVGLAVNDTNDVSKAGPTDSSAGTFAPASPSAAAGARSVPGYDVLVPIGEGGMGVVWKARQTKLNRLVALKMVLGEQRAGSKELIRFLDEAEAVAAVKHPHVVQVYEYGDASGRPFLAMEYLGGGSLADRLKRTGRLDPKAAAKLVETLADAVQEAHDMGIVHRDLKPANVLYDEHGELKVTDFGLAKRAGVGDLTATQAVMGTPAYMAPEQARGDTKLVGPQGDVYSLGVILYECLTGSKPFEAPDQLALLRKVAEDEPERPGKRIAGLPRDVELICLKCLAKDPADRYATARAMAVDLGRFAAGEPVSVRSTGVVERVAKWARRKPTLAAAYTLGLLAVVLGGLGGAAVWQWRAAERAQGEAEEQRDRANLARSEAETAQGLEAKARAGAERQREKFERFEYARTIQVAHQEWRDSNVAATIALLDGTRADLRGWEWRYVHRLCHSDLLTLRATPTPSEWCRSARTGRGSSPQVTTRRRRSGTPRAVLWSRHSRGTPSASPGRRSARTGRGSSPRVTVRRRKSGMPRAVP
jgi:eukaryotic-like serine/threonine-protein kinase